MINCSEDVEKLWIYVFVEVGDIDLFEKMVEFEKVVDFLLDIEDINEEDDIIIIIIIF